MELTFFSVCFTEVKSPYHYFAFFTESMKFPNEIPISFYIFGHLCHFHYCYLMSNAPPNVAVQRINIDQSFAKLRFHKRT